MLLPGSVLLLLLLLPACLACPPARERQKSRSGRLISDPSAGLNAVDSLETASSVPRAAKQISVEEEEGSGGGELTTITTLGDTTTTTSTTTTSTTTTTPTTTTTTTTTLNTRVPRTLEPSSKSAASCQVEK